MRNAIQGNVKWLDGNPGGKGGGNAHLKKKKTGPCVGWEGVCTFRVWFRRTMPKGLRVTSEKFLHWEAKAFWRVGWRENCGLEGSAAPGQT